MKRIITLLSLGLVGGLTLGAAALTTTDAENILFLKQEEKLARDVYQFLYAKWGHTTFANISVSEQRHMDAVDGLIARYRLNDTTPEESGVFTFPELNDLYAQLTAQGSQSLAEALAVGVVIEEMDIADLQEMLTATKESPIRRVLTNLLNGSNNHLDAFNKALDQLANSGLTVAPDDSGAQTCQPVGAGNVQQRRQKGKQQQQRGQP